MSTPGDITRWVAFGFGVAATVSLAALVALAYAAWDYWQWRKRQR